MKLLIARMNHETNTFSPVPTPLASFGIDGPTYGADAYAENLGGRTAMSAFIDLAKAAGADLITPISATANPSGPVEKTAYDTLCRHILDASDHCDAMMLDLHGAMVAENSHDGEGDLLERLKARHPEKAIAVALDLHGNVTQKMMDNADIIVSFKTYPHIDMYETGEHAGRLLLARLKGEISPALAWERLPLMTHTLKSASNSPAMCAAIQAAREAEQSSVLAASVLAGFALADIPAPCISVVTVGKDAASARQAARQIALKIWASREGFVYHSPPLAESIGSAKALAAKAGPQAGCGNPQGPILLLDHSDNCMSGGTCDTMDVLQEALTQGLGNIGVGPLCDPQAVEQLVHAGEGATVTLQLGNKRPLTSLGIVKEPVTLTGQVKHLGNGEYIISGPTYTGMKCSMGRTALFACGDLEIVITERTHEPWDLGVFTCVGLDPARKSFLLLKSRMYCRPVFFPIAKGFVECDSSGVTSSNYALFPFKNVHHPVYPLDPNTHWPNR
ncbi:M81 family metallopeptidase [Paralcaligenes sp. KSB-10]|uniref:M81 family metallopeptidase n=1 Tax=Paralcaligenes sp. KSB-10 TaxID=2901142 RepID=UPI001E342B9A|nr:M81 family metallopeptidase [Paralcaligenes sp. KSB-10]UHL63621.1 M81 family metallopeptidase [Paralcaligenes sp. KSB-10]